MRIKVDQNPAQRRKVPPQFFRKRKEPLESINSFFRRVALAREIKELIAGRSHGRRVEEYSGGVARYRKQLVPREYWSRGRPGTVGTRPAVEVG